MKNMVSDMQCRGKITQISRDIKTRGILITMSLTEVSEQALQTVSALDDLSVEMKKYRKKRSLDANAYFHVLVGKIADALTISKAKAITNTSIQRKDLNPTLSASMTEPTWN